MVYTVLVTDGFPCLGFSLAQACAHPEGAVLFFCERPAPKARPEKHGLGNLGLGVLLSVTVSLHIAILRIGISSGFWSSLTTGPDATGFKAQRIQRRYLESRPSASGALSFGVLLRRLFSSCDLRTL